MGEKVFVSVFAAVVGFAMALAALPDVIAPQPNGLLLVLTSASLCFCMNLVAEWLGVEDIQASLAVALLSSLVWWGLLTFIPSPWLALGSQTFWGNVTFITTLVFAQFFGRLPIRMLEYSYTRKKGP